MNEQIKIIAKNIMINEPHRKKKHSMFYFICKSSKGEFSIPCSLTFTYWYPNSVLNFSQPAYIKRKNSVLKFIANQKTVKIKSIIAAMMCSYDKRKKPLLQLEKTNTTRRAFWTEFR